VDAFQSGRRFHRLGHGPLRAFAFSRTVHDGKGHREHSALSFSLTEGTDFASVRGHQVTDDRKSQAQTARLTGHASIRLTEAPREHVRPPA
jgi:hypothetical protein